MDSELILDLFNFVGYQYSLPFMGGIYEKPEEEIAKDLAVLESLMDSKTVFITHSPAKGVLDRGILGALVGSTSILSIVNNRSIWAHVHGHCHGSFGREGKEF